MYAAAAGMAAVLAACAGAACAAPDDLALDGDIAACAHTGVHCFARVRTHRGEPVALVAPAGYTPADLQSAYALDPTLGAGVTIAVVDAFGYPSLESDLAVYRAQFGLPACTSAGGCLRILNQVGSASPLPAEGPAGDGWTVETALDVDMVSAACPACGIVVVETADIGDDLYQGELTAARSGATAISDSWGSLEDGLEDQLEPDFDHPGIATFVSSGDKAYDDGGNGPLYPSTSAHVIAVGGTSLSRSPLGATGWSQTAWSSSGSSCSTVIGKPSYQPASSGCTMRAAVDVSAVADPSTGVASYDTSGGMTGWAQVGGTSAASPLVAAAFAAAGHGDADAVFAYANAAAFTDVASGSNGSCGPPLCQAGPGWDGPTGVGTPVQAAIAAIGGGSADGPIPTITSPGDGATVPPGFTIEATAAAGTQYLELYVDGARLGAADRFPFAQSTASADLAPGLHQIVAIGYDDDHDAGSSAIHVTVGGTSGEGGCASAGAGDAGAAALVLALAACARRRRVCST